MRPVSSVWIDLLLLLLLTDIDLSVAAEPFEAYVPPEGDGKATLMSRDVSELDDSIDLSLILGVLFSV